MSVLGRGTAQEQELAARPENPASAPTGRVRGPSKQVNNTHNALATLYPHC